MAKRSAAKLKAPEMPCGNSTRRMRRTTTQAWGVRSGLTLICVASAHFAAGCATSKTMETAPERPNVAPTDRPAVVEALQLDGSEISPMYTELLSIDLPAVIRVAEAESLDIKQARQAVQASRGEYESAVGAAFPALVPTSIFEHVDGKVRATARLDEAQAGRWAVRSPAQVSG